MNYSAIIVAAGSGTRMHLGYNKVYAKLADGRSILSHSLSLFEKDEDCKQIILVTDYELFHSDHPILTGKITIARGGNTRQESVANGLGAVLCDTVLIHDGARPFLTKENLEAIKQAMQENDAACLMVPCKDTIKHVENGYVVNTYPRETLLAAQTPQAFRTSLILHCMAKAKEEGYTGTDDCSLVEKYSTIPVKAVLGSYANKKITTPEDL